jgi:hypothetical protein
MDSFVLNYAFESNLNQRRVVFDKRLQIIESRKFKTEVKIKILGFKGLKKWFKL